ncbi:MAG: lipopolysaccharide heptosyltransferase II [Xanthobacteraceae bacterium]
MQTADLRGRDFKNILLIKLSALGDVVQTLPVLNALRARYPKARIDWLIAEEFAEAVQDHPAISNVIVFSRGDWSAPWRAAPYVNAARLMATLRAAAYDLVIDLQGQLRSAVFAFGAGAPVRIGFDKPRKHVWKTLARKIPAEAKKHAWQGAREGSWLAYTHHLPLPTLDLHPVERYLGIAPMLGLDAAAPDFSLPVPPQAATRIDALLDYYDIGKAKPLVVMAPGTNWDTKEWRKDGFAEVARHFLSKGSAVVLIGSDSERALCEEVAKLAPGAVDLAGETTLPELAALIRRATLCIANDSGPMHLAVALARPVIGLFGPTDPIWAGPYRRGDAVLRVELACSPCYLRRLRDCPNDHACMKNLAPAKVIALADAMIAKLPARASAVAPAARLR